MNDSARTPGPRWSLFDYLDQSEWWKPRDAPPLRVEQMEHSHRRNLLRFLRWRADRLPTAHTNEAYRLLFLDPLGPRGEIAHDTVQRGLDAEFETIVADPAAWLEATPFVTRLSVLVEADDAIANVGPEWWETTEGAAV